MSVVPDDLPVLPFADADAWEAWVTANADAKGVWLKIAKKDSGHATVTYAEALDVALCHGWIDGQKRSFDAAWFLQRFTPRRPKGLWSKINIGHVERLTAAGRMHEAGLAQVAAAKADGRWDEAYEPPSTIAVPPDLAAALEANPSARNAFEGLDGANRFAVLYRVTQVKKAETRARKIEDFVAMLARGEVLHPPRKAKLK